MKIRMSVSQLCAVLIVSGCAIRPTAPPVLSPYADGRDWVVLEPLTFEFTTSDGIVSYLTVPKGFVTDLASTPPYVWSVAPPFGRYMTGAILHDYLYWTGLCKRADADKILFQVMRDANASDQEIATFYIALEKRGGEAYETNQNLRKAGWVRFIPPGVTRPPLDITWKEYQKRLFETNYRFEPPVQVKNPGMFCAELTKDIDTKAWFAKTKGFWNFWGLWT